MNFFKHFPQMLYTFKDGDSEFSLNLTNLTVRVMLAERVKSHVSVIYDYIVQDGERPDSVSVKLYGSSEYTWIILLLNDIMSLFDWPLTTKEFNSYIIEKYGSIAAAQSQTIYRTVDGYEIDGTSWAALPAAKRGTSITSFDKEYDLNERKRRIKVIPATFVGQLQSQLQSLLS